MPASVDDGAEGLDKGGLKGIAHRAQRGPGRVRALLERRGPGVDEEDILRPRARAPLLVASDEERRGVHPLREPERADADRASGLMRRQGDARDAGRRSPWKPTDHLRGVDMEQRVVLERARRERIHVCPCTKLVVGEHHGELRAARGVRDQRRAHSVVIQPRDR